MTQLSLNYDICRRKSRNSDTSRAAFAGIQAGLSEQRQAVLRAIQDARSGGITCRELANDWDVPMHRISGRFSELKALGLIVRSRLTPSRDGSGVYLCAKLIAEATPA